MAQGIIDVLRHDHEQARELFARLQAATGKRKSDLFDRLVRDLVGHEVAEEEVLRPVSRRHAGQRIAGARIKEEHRAEVLLKELQALDVACSQFDTKLKRLRRQVEAHAKAEETKEFPRVESRETAKRLEELAKSYRAAKKAAPTRPHPATPNTPEANLLLGPATALVDRTRDALRDGLKST